VCIVLCTIVAHNIAQNRPDNFPSYPPDNHHCSDDVYLRKGGAKLYKGCARRCMLLFEAPELSDCCFQAMCTNCLTHLFIFLQCFDAVGWVAGRASGRQKTESWGAGMGMCLRQGADLHKAQLMPLPPIVSCFNKMHISFFVSGTSSPG